MKMVLISDVREGDVFWGWVIIPIQQSWDGELVNTVTELFVDRYPRGCGEFLNPDMRNLYVRLTRQRGVIYIHGAEDHLIPKWTV